MGVSSTVSIDHRKRRAYSTPTYMQVYRRSWKTSLELYQENQHAAGAIVGMIVGAVKPKGRIAATNLYSWDPLPIIIIYMFRRKGCGFG